MFCFKNTFNPFCGTKVKKLNVYNVYNYMSKYSELIWCFNPKLQLTGGKPQNMNGFSALS